MQLIVSILNAAFGSERSKLLYTDHTWR